MLRKPITPAICRQVALEVAVDPAEIVAERHGLTKFVVETIVRFHDPDRPDPPLSPHRRHHSGDVALDPSDVARVLRMRREGHSITDISMELKIRPRLVRLCLRSKARFGARLGLRKGESYVRAPTRCPTCDAPLKIVPCRACRIRDLIRRGEKLWRDEEPAS